MIPGNWGNFGSTEQSKDSLYNMGYECVTAGCLGLGQRSQNFTTIRVWFGLLNIQGIGKLFLKRLAMMFFGLVTSTGFMGVDILTEQKA